MAFVFGSKEANELLARETGRRFDLRDVDPLEWQPAMEYPDEREQYCSVCGAYMEWVDCWNCDGKGGRDGDDLMEEDPLWYDEDDWEDCDVCRGRGGYWECASLPHDVAPFPTKEEFAAIEEAVERAIRSPEAVRERAKQLRGGA